jgi:hypothetical protein
LEEIIMAQRVKKAEKPKLQKYEVNSPELEQFLATGLGMDKKEAEDILAAYKENPLSVTPDERKRATSYLAALKTKPVAISKKPGWKRPPRR